jgi:hypothetical protein
VPNRDGARLPGQQDVLAKEGAGAEDGPQGVQLMLVG